MWLGLGLSLEEFLTLDLTEQRRRLCELSDVDQLLFVERHLNPISALLTGFPSESFLPVLPPPGYRSEHGVVIAFPYHPPGTSPETPQ